VDPLAGRLAQFGDAWRFDANLDVERFLALHEVFGADLAADRRFRTALGRAYERVAAWPAQPLSA
jgi:hypothetical protein